MLAEILLQKYEYHVPFYRQVKEYRHLGVRLPESTLSGWFKPVCELLSPLYSELVKLVTGSGYVQVDETTVRVINKGKGKTDKEYLWMVRAVMEKQVIFHYDDGSRSGQTIRNLLKDFKGYLQSDGYSAYNAFDGTKDCALLPVWPISEDIWSWHWMKIDHLLNMLLNKYRNYIILSR